MDVNFELYKVFYYVGKKLSFSAASKQLHISQSAVSQSIKLLEEKLDCRLFIRSSKQVSLTQEGSLLFQHIEQAFNVIKIGERNINEIKGLMQGEVRIGASDTICKYYLLPYFKQFTKLYPKIKIQVTNRTSTKCMELLKNGLIDVGIINIPQKLQYKNMTTQKIKPVQDVFIAGNHYLQLKNQELSLAELINYPILMLEKNSVTRSFFDHFLQQNGINIKPEIELGSVDLLIELTRIGLGISFVMEDAINEELINKDIFIINLKEKIPQRYLGIITNDQIPLPVAAQKFMNLLK